MNDEIYCKKCKSTNIIVKKQGISVSRAIGGSLILGPLGLLGGLIGKENIILECLNCGNQWKPSAPNFSEWPDYEER